MLKHAQVWRAIDRLAQEYGFSASGLARRAGLDPTTFNKSKRTTREGKLRWPSTESVAKILAATGASLGEFVSYMEEGSEGGVFRNIPLIGLAQAGADGYFDDAGYPTGGGWDEIPFPDLGDPHAYALEISGDSMEPAYRDGDIVIISPSAGVRRGDRVVVKTLAGEEAYAAVFEPFVLVKASEGMTPLHRAMGKILKRHPVSVNEAQVLLASYDHYRAFLFLENEASPLSPAAFGKILGLKERDAAKILSDFAKAGLVKKSRSGAYVCELSNEVLELPRAEILPPGLNDKMREYQAKMLASGKLAWRRMKTLRADAVELAGFYPLLSLNMSAASAYEIEEKTKNSAVFAIESRVVKLFDF